MHGVWVASKRTPLMSASNECAWRARGQQRVRGHGLGRHPADAGGAERSESNGHLACCTRMLVGRMTPSMPRWGATDCFIALWPALSRQGLLYYAIACFITPRPALSRYSLLYHATACFIALWPALLRYGLLYCPMTCFITLWPALSRHALLYYAMACFITL